MERKTRNPATKCNMDLRINSFVHSFSMERTEGIDRGRAAQEDVKKKSRKRGGKIGKVHGYVCGDAVG